MSNQEIRHRRFELRAAEDLGEGVVRGVVTTFDDPYPIGRSLREVITRSTFDLSQSVPLFFEHRWGDGPIGVSRSLAAGSDGLEAEFELFLDDPRARSVWRAMKAGALREFSIGFMPTELTEERSAEHTTEKIIKGDLIEVSSVVRGANPNTETVSTRAVDPAAAAAPPAIDPATGLPVEAEEEQPTKAQLLGQVGEVVQLALDLDMGEALPKIIKQYLDLLAPEPAPAQLAPAAPGAPAAPPAAPPAARALPDDLSPSLFRALSA